MSDDLNWASVVTDAFWNETVPDEGKPSPNEHSCRLKDPDQYDSIRRKNNAAKHEGKRIDFIYGIKQKDGKKVSELQAMRYPKGTWSAGDARKHCKDHDGILFEPAGESADDAAFETKDLPFMLKADDVSDSGRFKGHAAAFNNIDSYGDVIEPGAFEKTLKEKAFEDIPILWYHQPWEPIGFPVEMHEDRRGLFVEGQLLIEDPTAKKVHLMMKNRVVKRLSIGFKPMKHYFKEKDKQQIRHLQDIDLWEFSPVTFAANQRATITNVKSARSPKELEQILREGGPLSYESAKYLASRHRFDSPCEVDEFGQQRTLASPCEVDESELLVEVRTLLRSSRSIFDMGGQIECLIRKSPARTPPFSRTSRVI